MRPFEEKNSTKTSSTEFAYRKVRLWTIDYCPLTLAVFAFGEPCATVFYWLLIFFTFTTSKKILRNPSRNFIKFAFIIAKRKIIQETLRNPVYRNSKRIAEELYYLVQALLNSTLTTRWNKKSLNIFLKAIFMNNDFLRLTREWRKNYGSGPPGFLVISPTKLCNLRCPNCYANSAGEQDKLPYWVVKRIIGDARDLWGNRFFVISGGEPLIYHSDGKSILDITDEFPDSIFLMYTNSILISEEITQRLAKSGNVTPAISVEGMKASTDRRRGSGTFDKILAVMATLKKHHIYFGISITATKENCEEVLSDEFINFFFDKMGVQYGWLFHYMPLGRNISADLMPTPTQRVWMWQRSWELIKKKKIFLIDFWNHGPASSGCIAGGREGGYLHINWHGDVAPCVFFPYAVSNVQEIFKKGGTLNDVIRTPFFEAIRDWQYNYGFPHRKADRHQPFHNKEQGIVGNWLRPCPMRDHFQDAVQIIKKHNARPMDYAPDCITLQDKGFFNTLETYDEEIKKLTDPIWEKTYL